MRTEYHIQKLNEVFETRQEKNEKYSLRAYARDLGLDPSTLSKVLQRQRNFPLGKVEQVVRNLGLQFDEKIDFSNSILKTRGMIVPANKNPAVPLKLSQDEHFRILSEWEHFALFSLIETAGFKNDIVWMTKRLNLSTQRCEQVLQTLISVGLVKENNDGTLQLVEKMLSSSDGVSSLALRLAHQRELGLAQQSLKIHNVTERDFSSLTISANRNQLQKAQKLTRQYLTELMELMQHGERDDVFQISVQIFPLTTPNKSKKT